jgi:phosphohistidine phosphatase SixA
MTMDISEATEITARDLTADKVIVATIAQVAAGADRYRVIGHDPSTGEPVELTLTEAVEARFEEAGMLRAGSPAAAVAFQHALEFASAAGYEVRGLKRGKAG